VKSVPLLKGIFKLTKEKILSPDIDKIAFRQKCSFNEHIKNWVAFEFFTIKTVHFYSLK
jgi:hypothetical protein